MIDLEYDLVEQSWEKFLRDAVPGDSVSVAQLLTILEGQEEWIVEDALDLAASKNLTLDISQLPHTNLSGELSSRLRLEQELSKYPLRSTDFPDNDPLRLYLEELQSTGPADDLTELIRRCSQGDQKAMEQLTHAELPLVVDMARQFTGYGVLLLDLIQEGSMGLWQAVCTAVGCDYIRQRDAMIRFQMAKAVTLQARAGGVGQKLKRSIEDFRQVDERLLSELGRNPTLEEIALELHMGPEEAASVQKMLTDARRLAQATPSDDSDQENDPTDAEDEQAVEDTALFRTRARILDMLSTLSQRDAQILTMRYGLEGGLPMTAEEVGACLSMTPAAVVQAEAAALASLRGNQ